MGDPTGGIESEKGKAGRGEEAGADAAGTAVVPALVDTSAADCLAAAGEASGEWKLGAGGDEDTEEMLSPPAAPAPAAAAACCRM